MAERVAHNHSSPGWRLAAVVLVIGAAFLLAYGLQLQGVLSATATIVAVAVIHVAGALGRRRGASEVPPVEGRMRVVTEKARTVLAGVLEDLPWLRPWVGRGTLSVEILKGLAFGVLTFTLQQMITGMVEPVAPGAALLIGVSLSVALLHLTSTALTGGHRGELTATVAAAVEAFPILGSLLTRQSWPVEAAKGLVKGLLVFMLRAPLLVVAGWFSSGYFAGAIVALVAAAVIAPSAVTWVKAQLTTTRTPEPEKRVSQ